MSIKRTNIGLNNAMAAMGVSYKGVIPEFRENRLKDFTPLGMKLEGQYENDRNGDHSELFKAILREVFDVTDVICAHHITFVRHEQRCEGGHTFSYEIVQEIPSADALIFDHEIAKKIWGTGWKETLMLLATYPPETRDDEFARLYYARGEDGG